MYHIQLKNILRKGPFHPEQQFRGRKYNLKIISPNYKFVLQTDSAKTKLHKLLPGPNLTYPFALPTEYNFLASNNLFQNLFRCHESIINLLQLLKEALCLNFGRGKWPMFQS